MRDLSIYKGIIKSGALSVQLGSAIKKRFAERNAFDLAQMR